jgi:hypothetical protein
VRLYILGLEWHDQVRILFASCLLEDVLKVDDLRVKFTLARRPLVNIISKRCGLSELVDKVVRFIQSFFPL